MRSFSITKYYAAVVFIVLLCLTCEKINNFIHILLHTCIAGWETYMGWNMYRMRHFNNHDNLTCYDRVWHWTFVKELALFTFGVWYRASFVCSPDWAKEPMVTFEQKTFIIKTFMMMMMHQWCIHQHDDGCIHQHDDGCILQHDDASMM
jgi:hypothetical protein